MPRRRPLPPNLTPGPAVPPKTAPGGGVAPSPYSIPHPSGWPAATPGTITTTGRMFSGPFAPPPPPPPPRHPAAAVAGTHTASKGAACSSVNPELGDYKFDGKYVPYPEADPETFLWEVEIATRRAAAQGLAPTAADREVLFRLLNNARMARDERTEEVLSTQAKADERLVERERALTMRDQEIKVLQHQREVMLNILHGGRCTTCSRSPTLTLPCADPVHAALYEIAKAVNPVVGSDRAAVRDPEAERGCEVIAEAIARQTQAGVQQLRHHLMKGVKK